MEPVTKEECVEMLKEAEIEVTADTISQLKGSLDAIRKGSKGKIIHL